MRVSILLIRSLTFDHQTTERKQLMIRFVGEIPIATIDRNCPRLSTYGRIFWSANKVNFSKKEMRQNARSLYKGPLFVGQTTREVSVLEVQNHLRKSNREFAEVMEAFWVGANAQDIVRKFTNILIPGTIGRPPSDSSMFCPLIFVFGNSISLGIEHLKHEDFKLVIPRSAYVLVRKAG